MFFEHWSREIAKAIEASGAPLEVDFVEKALPPINAVLERRLSGVSYWADNRKFGRVWGGPFAPDDTLHFGYTDGEIMPNGDLCWTLVQSSAPRGQRISEAEAMAILLYGHWPNLHLEGWEHVDATKLLSAFLYRREVRIVVRE